MATVDEVQTGYDACVAGAGLVDRSEAGKLLLTGPQAREFLDGQVSNEIKTLTAGSGRYATLLTNKGRMLADLRLFAFTEESLLLVTERPTLQVLFDQVRRGLIGWQAELHKRTLELGLLSLIGPRSEDVARAAGLPLPGAAEHDIVALGADGAVIRTDLGLDVLPMAADVATIRTSLLAAGAVETAEAAAEILRVETGRPRFGIDADDSTMPEEAGIVDRAVSFKKGCYVGQETVARLHWKGKPNRHLRGLRSTTPLIPGTPVTILREDGTLREIGHVGTAVISPRLGPIALALLRREAEPGASVTAGDVEADVIALPFA